MVFSMETAKRLGKKSMLSRRMFIAEDSLNEFTTLIEATRRLKRTNPVEASLRATMAVLERTKTLKRSDLRARSRDSYRNVKNLYYRNLLVTRSR